MASTILIVEDDRAYRQEVARYFQRLRFVVHEAERVDQALNYLEQYQVDLVILDIGLGKKAALAGTGKPAVPCGCSGYGLLDMIRARPAYTPVIVLTSLSEPIYEVACLNHGADDFLLKQIEFEVLAARVQNALRKTAPLCGRCEADASQTAPQTESGSRSDVSTLFQAGDFQIDVEHRLVRVCGGPYKDLSEREVKLLRLLAESPGKVFTKEDVLKMLWSKEAQPTHYSVDALVKSVRRKIEPGTGKPRYLLCCRGLGYRLELAGSSDAGAGFVDD